jgi:flagellar motor switch/type III secretory pathway protein FliN
MTLAFRHWLPADAAAPRLALGAVADMAEAWSREWFAGEGLRAAGAFVRNAEPRAELRKIEWLVCEGGLAIGMPRDGAAAIGARVLGIALGQAERPRADVALLEGVAGECLDDLKRRAAVLLQLPRTAAWTAAEGSGREGGAVHRIDISAPDRSLVLVLELGADLFARFVKAKLPLAPEPAPLGDPQQALAGLRVRASAALGSCRISVAELGGLAAGDVLVLGTGIDAAVPLAIEGRVLPRGQCIPVEAGAGLALKMTQALTG